MKVWETKDKYGKELFYMGSQPPIRIETAVSIIYQYEWKESNRIEVTKRKPDYNKMIANVTRGLFWNNESPDRKRLRYLSDYNDDCGIIKFKARDSFWYDNFVPCQVIELDPITMEPKELLK